MRPPPLRSWFTGRIDRRGFLRGLLMTYVIVFLLFITAMLVSALTGWGRAPAVRVFAVLAAFVALVGYASLSIRRAHDLGWSGWIPSLGLALAVMVNMKFLDARVPDYVDNLIQLAILLVGGMAPGQPGANRYGAPRTAPGDFPLPDRSLFEPRPS